MYTVYKHTAPNGKVYIGITCQTLEERWKDGRGYKGQVFYKAIQKYGWENIKHEKICECSKKDDAEKVEIILIKHYKSNQKQYGYNVSNGGNVGGKHSEETKRKIGAKHKGKIVSEETKMLMRLHHHDVSKENNPNYGKKFSEERRKQMSEARKGKRMGVESPRFGKKHSEETLKRMREVKLGKMCGIENPMSRSIEQYSKNGDFIKRYICILDAQKELNIVKGGEGHISACAKGRLKTAYGYIWKYADEREDLNRGLV